MIEQLKLRLLAAGFEIAHIDPYGDDDADPNIELVDGRNIQVSAYIPPFPYSVGRYEDNAWYSQPCANIDAVIQELEILR